MENQVEKNYKTRECVRKAVKKYNNNVKEHNPEKYNDILNYHRAYNKQYYQKMKDDRAKLKDLLQKLNAIL